VFFSLAAAGLVRIDQSTNLSELLAVCPLIEQIPNLVPVLIELHSVRRTILNGTSKLNLKTAEVAILSREIEQERPGRRLYALRECVEKAEAEGKTIKAMLDEQLTAFYRLMGQVDELTTMNP
jgi:hypothetical protein